MKVSKMLTVYQLAFMPSFFPVNCYLVEEEQSLTLIDAALPYSAGPILKTSKQIGKPITHIVLTHAHEDHVGSLDALKKLLPNAVVSISERDALLLEGDRSLLPSESGSIRGGVPKKVTTRPDVLLHHGDCIGSLEVVQTPGHTPGSITLLDKRSRALIAGDAFQTQGGIAVSGVLQPWFPFPALATWNRAIALESARKLTSYNPSLLAVGHGKMLPDPVKAMNAAIEACEKRLCS